MLPGSLRPGGSEPGGVYCRVMPLLMPPGASPHLGLVGTGEARASRPGGARATAEHSGMRVTLRPRAHVSNEVEN